MTCLTIICLYSTIFTSPLGNYLLISMFAQVLSNCFVNSVNEETDCAYFVSIVVITRIKISSSFNRFILFDHVFLLKCVLLTKFNSVVCALGN